MNFDAVIAYIRRLREHRNMSQSALAEQVRRFLKSETTPSDRTVRRWETGETQPSITEMVGILQVLGGRISDVSLLLLEPIATEQTAEALADEAIDTKNAQHLHALVIDAMDEETRDLFMILREVQLRKKLPELIDFGHYLCEH